MTWAEGQARIGLLRDRHGVGQRVERTVGEVHGTEDRPEEGRRRHRLRDARRDDQNGRACLPENPFGDRSQEEAFEARPPMAPDDEQIGVHRGRLAEDLVDWAAFPNGRFDRDARSRLVRDEPLEFLARAI
jgi:hypothetical protein